ncbi:MAG: gliding motility-associated C-terminal domain-containing protein, partial [Cyclobacteriaceae bacterium]
IESDKGRFSVNFVAGCTPLEVTITNLYPDKSINVDFFPEGRQNANDPAFDPVQTGPDTYTYTYDEPGDYLLEQILALPDDQIDDNEDKYDQITISVYEPLAPSASVFRCTNNAVRVIIDTEVDSYDQYQIDYGDGNVSLTDGTSIPVYSYATGGDYTIRIDGLYAGGKMNCTSFTQTLTTLQQLEAGQIQLAEVLSTDGSNGEVRLSFNLDPDITYNLEVDRDGSDNFSYVRTLDLNTTETVVDGLNTEDSYYCFRVVATTGCSDAEVPSNVVCSVNTQAEARNNENYITWDTEVIGFDSYDLFRDNELIASITDPGTKNFTDTDVACQVEYCYTVVASSITSASQSMDACATAISTQTPPSINDLAVSIVDDAVVVSFIPPEEETNGVTILLRSQNEGNFLPLDEFSGTTYEDTRVNLNLNEYCYTTSYRDECGNVSAASPVACPIILELEENGDEILLDWNEYFGFEQLKYYVIERLDESGQAISAETVSIPGATIQADLEEDIYFAYRVGAVSVNTTPSGDPLIAYSNIVIITLEPEFALPNAFTPDGDGLNDRYSPLGNYVESFSLYVYNRWGELVYAQEGGQQGWDGTFSGTEAPEGRYTCVTEIRDSRGNTTTLREGFMLLRNR